MTNLIMVVMITVVIISMQVFLSLRSNKYFGLIIPGINLTCLAVISLLFTDMVVAILWFLFAAVQAGIWLGIYAACRKKVAANASRTMDKMKIADL